MTEISQIHSESKPDETVVARGRIFELVQFEQGDGRVFEVARRAPGVRVIIADLQTEVILLTKEFRRELGDWDYRLPGGKVFDTLEEYDQHRKSGDDIVPAAMQKAVGECIEEAGVDIEETQFIKKSTLGATVEWDLYIFVATQWKRSSDGQKLEAGEEVESAELFSYDDVEQIILQGKIQEERVAMVLLQWIHAQRKAKE